MKMLVLGLNGSFSRQDQRLVPGMAEHIFHDASACLIRDGRLVAAVEEERINRVKKTNRFPINAIKAVLGQVGAAPRDIDAIAFYLGEGFADSLLNAMYIRNRHVELKYSRQLLRESLFDELGIDLPDDRAIFVQHHHAHAFSAYFNSGMADALVMVMDGRGEVHSGTVFEAAGGELSVLADFPIADSLGHLYLDGTCLLGYGLGDEYKVMGLSSYGDPSVYRKLFDELYVLEPEGRYHLCFGEYSKNLSGQNLLGLYFFEHGLRPRRREQSFTREHMDFAAGLQEMLENITLHVLAYWGGRVGSGNLCFTGGVAHNSRLNGKLIRAGMFREVFVHPACYDAGAAEGAGLFVSAALGSPPRVRRLRSASLGPDLPSVDEVERALGRWAGFVEVEPLEHVAARTAELLAGGAVVGWVQGRLEFGPRALGNRSILADPRPAEHKARINSIVKEREGYRPFAPAVLGEAASDYFEFPDATRANYDFMSFVVPVREGRKSELGAVTHVDGTARVQVVDRSVNPTFHEVIAEFGRITGTPVLLNTSFNNNAEPIVCSVDDAVTGLLTTSLDRLVVGSYLVTVSGNILQRLGRLVPRFTKLTRLSAVAMRNGAEMRNEYRIHLDHSESDLVTVSRETYDLLRNLDGRSTLQALAEFSGVRLNQVSGELFRLWQKRMLCFLPS